MERISDEDIENGLLQDIMKNLRETDENVFFLKVFSHIDNIEMVIGLFFLQYFMKKKVQMNMEEKEFIQY